MSDKEEKMELFMNLMEEAGLPLQDRADDSDESDPDELELEGDLLNIPAMALPVAMRIGDLNPLSRMMERVHLFGHPDEKSVPSDTVRTRGITTKGSVLTYSDEAGDIGVWVYGKAMSETLSYFEAHILCTAEESKMVIGLVPFTHPLNKHPGHESHSIGYHGDEGRPYTQGNGGEWFGPKFSAMDIVGCGIRFLGNSNPDSKVEAFFTKNGREIGHSEVIVPFGGLFPAVSLHGEKERCKMDMEARFVDLDAADMRVPTTPNDWARLHDIRLRDGHLEYCGKGSMRFKAHHGLAQARQPLNCQNHYFEIQIVHPGENCCIAVGLAHKKYPETKHPGWVKGSVAYHADDGKIFTGIGRGKPFGPKCSKGDIMGCGILFPRQSDEEQPPMHEKFLPRQMRADMMSDTSDSSSDSDSNEDSDSSDRDLLDVSEDESWWERENFKNRPLVEVFFTKNGKRLGKRQVRIPAGGFFPTIGMMSSNERVLVDLQPLTG